MRLDTSSLRRDNETTLATIFAAECPMSPGAYCPVDVAPRVGGALFVEPMPLALAKSIAAEKPADPRRPSA